MRSNIVATYLTLLGAAHGLLAGASTLHYDCHPFVIPIPVTNIPIFVLPFPAPQDQLQATSILNAATARTQPPQSAPHLLNLTATYNISGEYCWPTNIAPVSTSPTLQILSHGLGFNRSYWDFRLLTNVSDPQYSYISSATSLGHHTISYNRLGIAGSTLADPSTEVQTAVELAILTALTIIARAGGIPSQPAVPSNVIHVGHSFGSILTVALAATSPVLSDGIVLTGFSGLFAYQSNFLISTNLLIANHADPARFPATQYRNSYVTWPSAASNQYAFFAYPAFDPAVLTQAEATKQPFALGEIFSGPLIPSVAPAFKGPVLYIDGEKDLIFCASNCTGLIEPGSDAFKAFNGSSDVSSIIVQGFGHGMNLHYDAAGKVYARINGWLKGHGF
ncbi:hypothetical protein H2198_006181 [Neophaeococcomyces mojaviensis]|uniref:Uncharacterized protein n=1 Tax=Neophaeococcomyces mojaviensis TaxID=3383035 RepID=A0ACC3A3H4_9EURO|nr:hypothetical protein H2198_006181 [Knufia sp. JES_112]